MNIAIIPARSGSKRIPGKNTKNFLTRPIISYSIDAAIESNLFDEVMVSTDDESIALLSISLGAKVPFLRSKENSSDTATTIDVVREVIDDYASIDVSFNTICCLYPCAPFVSSSLLIKAYNKLLDNKFDCVFPVVKYGHPIQRALRVEPGNLVKMLNFENMQIRTQDLEDSYHDSGQFYFLDRRYINRAQGLWSDNTGCVVLSELECHDIDNLDDWLIAEAKFRLAHDS